MKRSGLLLFCSLALLLLSGPADAQLPSPEGEGPAVIAQGKGKYPPVKDEDGNEVKVPKFDEKAMQCAMKCQEPTAKCMNSCAADNNKCKGKCATALEACTSKCNAKQKN